MLADRVGIVADYYDIAGTCHVTTDDMRRAILAAMNVQVATRGGADRGTHMPGITVPGCKGARTDPCDSGGT
ncbi:MAG: hypothetical protein MRJ68_13175 [Nitrospira sp.]|nr:hypothetical protein [Nitrospira sp.]